MQRTGTCTAKFVCDRKHCVRFAATFRSVPLCYFHNALPSPTPPTPPPLRPLLLRDYTLAAIMQRWLNVFKYLHIKERAAQFRIIDNGPGISVYVAGAAFCVRTGTFSGELHRKFLPVWQTQSLVKLSVYLSVLIKLLIS